MANRRVWLRNLAGRGRSARRSSVLMSGAGVLGTMLSFVVVGSGPTALAVAPVISHAPRVATGNPHGNYNTWAASNWSGYAETGSFTGVSGTWTVPSVATSSSATYSSLWIGVDGFNNSNLIQTGTEEDYYNGAPHYNAWWEILPAAETPITNPVSPGDRMSASITETANVVGSGGRFFRHSEHVWNISISDTSKNWTFNISEAYGGSGASAEWIVEAPQVGGRIATLAHYSFGNVKPPTAGIGSTVGDFDNTMVQKSTIGSAFVGAGLSYGNDAGVMIQNNAQVSTPSNPDGAGTAYDAWYGSTSQWSPTS